MKGIRNVFDKEYFTVGATVKVEEGIGEREEITWYGQILSVNDSKLEIVYVDTDSNLMIEEVDTEDVLSEVIGVKVIG